MKVSLNDLEVFTMNDSGMHVMLIPKERIEVSDGDDLRVTTGDVEYELAVETVLFRGAVVNVRENATGVQIIHGECVSWAQCGNDLVCAYVQRSIEEIKRMKERLCKESTVHKDYWWEEVKKGLKGIL